MKKRMFVVIVIMVFLIYFGGDYLASKINFMISRSFIKHRDVMRRKNFQTYRNKASYRSLLQRKSFAASRHVFEIDDEYADSFYVEREKEYINDAPLLKVQLASSAKFSTLMTKRVYYVLGEDIYVNIRIFDGYRRPKKRGGDDVRVWMTSGKNACAAEVTDLNNGHYVARLRALWAGKAKIEASLAFSREEIRALWQQRRELKVLRYSIGKFSKSDNEGELTFCSPFPNIPGAVGLCNFTNMNFAPYYCGRPLTPGLNCSDWSEVFTGRYSKMKLTEPEVDLLSRNRRINLFPRDISVDIENAPSPSLPACNEIEKASTWSLTAPTGHFRDKKWHPSFCDKTLTPPSLKSCLRNVTLTLIGDSTVRQWYETTLKFLNCTKDTVDTAGWSKRVERHCDIPDIGFRITFGIHGFPYSVADKMDTVANMKSIPLRLQTLQISKKHFIIIHMYLHFLFFHTSVFVTRVRNLRTTLIAFLEKYPHVKIAIKGPHSFVSVDNKPIAKADYFGQLYSRIIKRELFDLRERIWYIDFWDMSVAAKNVQIHPQAWFVLENVKLFFNFVCGV